MKENKKKSRLWLAGIIIVALAFTGQMAAQAAGDDVQLSGRAAVRTMEAQSEAGEDYQSIFSNRFIVQMPPLYFGMDVASFAKVNEDGTIDSLHFGYKDDVISVFEQTRYMEVSDLSDGEKEALDAGMKESFAELEALDFVTVSSHIGTSYYSLTCKTERLEEEEVRKQAVEADLIVLDDEDGAMSMEATEERLL